MKILLYNPAKFEPKDIVELSERLNAWPIRCSGIETLEIKEV